MSLIGTKWIKLSQNKYDLKKASILNALGERKTLYIGTVIKQRG